MKNYIQVSFFPLTTASSEILIALLSENGFEGFEEEQEKLHAFIAAGDYNQEAVEDFARMAGCQFSTENIAAQNWNALWESNFQPVEVGDFVYVRASFHPPASGVEHEIVITPKMSFGTGHHATTYMMMQSMRSLEFNNKAVFDFGTGTGVLAILAARLGAFRVLAIDNDEWSILNAAENLQVNQVTQVELRQADHADMGEEFDIILANINRHIILDNMIHLRRQLRPGGILLLSGLLAGDEGMVLESATLAGLALADRLERHNWLCLKLS